MNSIKLAPNEYFPGVSMTVLGGLERYLNNGIMPGGFLTAVLENNLSQAFGRADSYNSANLKDIVAYIYNYVPSSAWGSPAKVSAWVNAIRKEAAND